MRARDVMERRVLTIREDAALSEIAELFMLHDVFGAPVVDDAGRILGIVTQQDVFFGSMTRPGSNRGRAPDRRDEPVARDVMTAPAICAPEDAEVTELADLMWRMRVHRIPIVRDGRVAGMVSAMDLCRAISSGSVGSFAVL